ncbi:EAL domain-containing protein [Rhodovulum sp. P5]|uniref:EAL domain-containing protein n=1 Tax=Rhodovulum sp. P5 TaxID=1564506 RepID=UPI0020A3E704|nr:EAL domain-containing protein [Rhodovulum sp. P5]
MSVPRERPRAGEWLVDLETGAIELSDSIQDVLGHALDGGRLSFHRLRSSIHPADRKAALCGLRRVMRGESRSFEVAFRLIGTDGTEIWFRATGERRVRTAPHHAELVCGTLTAHGVPVSAAPAGRVTPTQAVETAEILRVAAENGGVVPWHRIPETGASWFGQNLNTVLGLPAETQLTSAEFRRRIHPDDAQAVTDRQAAIEAGEAETFEAEFRVLHADGSWRWLASKGKKVDRSAASMPSMICGSLTDITARKHDQARLSDAVESARRARDRLNTLVFNAPSALFEYRVAADGSVSLPYFGAKLCEITGVTRDEIATDSTAFERHIHPEDLGALRQTRDAAGKDMTAANVRHRIVHPEKGLRWVVSSFKPTAFADGTRVFYCSIIDITSEMEAEGRAAQAAEEVQKAHERLRAVADIAPAGLYEYRMAPDGQIDFPYTSARFEDLIGFDRAEIEALGSGVFGRIHPDDVPEVLARAEESAKSLTPWNMRFRLTHPQRGMVWLHGASIPRRDPDGSVIWTGAMNDVTQDVQREAELRRAHRLAEEMRAENERQALHDGLTGLPNRRYYDQMLAKRLEGAFADGPKGCALIRIDLDHFKYVNDTLGHEAGDEVLLRVAGVLRDNIRAGDFAARIGGDEFSIILGPSMSRRNAGEIVERIQAQLAEPFLYNGRPCRFGASFGIAYADDITAFGAELQVFADAALYRAKEGGRNRMEFFTADLHRELLEERRLAKDLHEALERDQFLPYFQPQISVSTGEVVGVETLLRWNHPKRGLLTPDAFLRVAEQLRLVPEIDRMVMRKARDALARWRANGLVIPKISMNVCAGRVQDPDLVSLACEMSGEGTKVAFELMESILVEDESTALAHGLRKIREAGIDIEVDDFGSGQASIIGLTEIAPSALKIDRRIVAPVADDEGARTVVRAIVEIAQTLGIRTVAEGVETQAHADILAEIGCDVLQGFHFSTPESEEDFLRRALARCRNVA